MVSEIIYDKELVDMVNENVTKITFWILIINGILTVVAMLLINSSMRLSIYSHRFTIKTMQMVEQQNRSLENLLFGEVLN